MKRWLAFLLVLSTLPVSTLAGAPSSRGPLCARILGASEVQSLDQIEAVASAEVTLADGRLLVVQQLSKEAMQSLGASKPGKGVYRPKATEFPTQGVVRVATKPIVRQVLCRTRPCTHP